MAITLLLIILVGLFLLIREINRHYYILAIAKRVRTEDGSDLTKKVVVIPGQSVFGNNLDLLDNSPATLFKFLRSCREQAKGRSYLFYFLLAPVYNVVTAEDAEEIFQGQQFITKSVVYGLLKPFLGDGLLLSTGDKWHSQRKLLTPAFHFNVLLSFLEIFKSETEKQLKILEHRVDEVLPLDDVIAEFTLNTICETALGIKLSELEGGSRYRHAIHEIEQVNIHRACNPVLYYDFVFVWQREKYRHLQKYLKIAHDFSSKIIEKKRQEYREALLKRSENFEDENFGPKRRYAMLDTLLAAESKGLIDHRSICEEVDTFMFEGYDTTAMCLRFALLNLAWRADVQERCFQELQHYDSLQELSVFDFNKLDYLECVIKETLRLYPSVPFVARMCNTELHANGLILPRNTQINIHIYDILRDERHFPQPNKFDPDRFLPENTTNRHAFAYVPFSAGPRNCIGQKFALLEIKVFLSNIIKNYHIMPVTRIEDVVLHAGLVLRTAEPIKIKLKRRE